MAKKINKTCITCGKSYQIYCVSCREAVNQPGWKTIFHNENCKTIHHVCSMFNAKKMTQEEAKAILASCDLSNKNNFNDTVKRIIDEICVEKLVSVGEPVSEKNIESSVESFEAPIGIVCEQEVLSVAEEEILPVESENSSEEESVILSSEPSVLNTGNYRRKKKKNR